MYSARSVLPRAARGDLAVEMSEAGSAFFLEESWKDFPGRCM